MGEERRKIWEIMCVVERGVGRGMGKMSDAATTKGFCVVARH
jgi:hypothetical protein